jgi:5'-nucleotidase
MLPILNKLEISAACIGNHDFDFGIENLISLINDTNFPWLISNCFDVKSRRPLAEAYVKHIIEFNGLKVDSKL